MTHMPYHLLLALPLAISLLVPAHALADASGQAPPISTSLQTAGIDPNKQTTLGLYLTPQEAYASIQRNPAGVLFVDIRTPVEVEYVGWSNLADKNIPYLLDDMSAWDERKQELRQRPNTDFIPRLEATLKAKGLDASSPIILMCRSGNRSAKAADEMAKHGYPQVYSIVEGFEGDKAKAGVNKGKRTVNGWKNAGLPWSYTLEKDKIHLSAQAKAEK